MRYFDLLTIELESSLVNVPHSKVSICRRPCKHAARVRRSLRGSHVSLSKLVVIDAGQVVPIVEAGGEYVVVVLPLHELHER